MTQQKANDVFAQLFEESLIQSPLLPGAIISASIERIEDKYIIVDAGLKSESYIPIEQFYNDNGELDVFVGDDVKVVLEAMEDGFGSTRLSRERAKRLESWEKLEKAYTEKKAIRGIIAGRVKGGFTVEIDKIRAFLPGSLVDVKPVHDPEMLEGKEFEFKVIKVDAKRNNIVVSRRAVLEAENNVERATLLANLQEGLVLEGLVKNLTEYGAFIDLGGVDGLLHITDISWKRVRHPRELLTLGDKIKVIVLKIDRDNMRVSLGLKQLSTDPWKSILETYPVNTRVTGRVTNITDYGSFVEIEEGIEGLVHVSEMDWTNRNVNPNKIVHLGQEVEVIVLEVDADRRRISLGMKQCADNPWAVFAEKHHKNEQITGKIKSITDFGIFLELEGNIDGLVYLSDIAWNETEAQEKLRQYQKGDELTVVVLSIDVERERIALGLKQLEGDPLTNFMATHEKGGLVTGQVIENNADQFILVQLADNVQGIIRANELTNSSEAEEEENKTEEKGTKNRLQPGESVEASLIGLDRKVNAILLSLKTKTTKETNKKLASKATKSGNQPNGHVSAKKKTSSETKLKTTLGDLFKDHMREK